MCKFVLFFVFILLLSGSVNINADSYGEKAFIIWNVGGNGSGNLTSISEALSYAEEGDEIHVYPGVYTEKIVLNISVKITGLDGYQNTIIQGFQNNTPLLVNADNCEISGFTIRKPGTNFEHASCVGILGDSCNFSKNKVIMEKVYHGYTKSAVEITKSMNTNILDNILTFDDENPLIEDGISIRENAGNLLIRGNNISNFGVGIKLERKCNNTIISENNVHNNSNAIIIYGNKCNISQNKIYDNKYWGIMIQDGDESTVFENDIKGIKDEDSGIMVYRSAEKTIVKRNKVKDNGLYGIYLVNCDGVEVTENDLLNCNIFSFKHLKNIMRKNTIIKNYYSIKDRNIFGWQKLPGEMLILAYFESTWEIPWITLDKNPADTPFIE